MIALSVNLNKIALLRNSRTGNNPNVLAFAQSAIENGARGITVHPRPDGRHIRDQDVSQLAALILEHNSRIDSELDTLSRNQIEFNIEGNPFAPPSSQDQSGYSAYRGLLDYAKVFRPDQVTLVPDGDAQLTSDHGFDLTQDAERISPIVQSFKHLGVRVSLFMDPDIEQIKLCKSVGADRIELYTGPYAWAPTPALAEELYKKHHEAAVFAQNEGLGVNAGHDLDLDNLQRYRNLPGLAEVSIGHGITVDALRYGWENCIAKYVEVLKIP